ncbi:MAG: hypothetical protein ACKO4U_22375 [Caldilinea sp.]|jgi:lipopolysaccharide/colanic/teichoic acid biosynthesis glycosyltransferase
MEIGRAQIRQGNLLPDAERLTRYGRFLRSTFLDELLDMRHVLCYEGVLQVGGSRGTRM